MTKTTVTPAGTKAKPATVKRPVAMKRLHTANQDMVARTPGLNDDSTVADLQQAIKDEWFANA